MSKFLSTPSARRATVRCRNHQTLCTNFYPRPPRGGRPAIEKFQHEAERFLSTPSARRATRRRRAWLADFSISIHALREEGDQLRAFAARHIGISIHALREEGDRKPWRTSNPQKDFYPRPPRGGRPSIVSQYPSFLRFLSTPSARRATDDKGTYAYESIFLSTPSARRATPNRGPSEANDQFLSTPSARRATHPDIGLVHQQPISIHALREEGDQDAALFVPFDSISIHALREEGDIRRRRWHERWCHFYPRPPRGGRHDTAAAVDQERIFLSTPSARRATAKVDR